MKKSIYFKIVIMFILTIIVGSFISSVLVQYLYFEKMFDKYGSAITAIAEDISIMYRSKSEEEFNKVMNTNLFSSYYIEFYCEGKKIESYGKPIKEELIPQELGHVELNKEVYYKKPKFFNLDQINSVIIAYPFLHDGKNYQIIMSPGGEQIGVDGIVLIEINIIVLILTGLISFAIIGRVIVKRIKILIKASKEVSKGNYSVQIYDKGNDELSQLFDTFNTMVKKIDETEKMSKDFVSNVSHEIQSPITSIMGFASVIQSDSINNEDKKEYAKIIEEESKRLSRLSENLLKLASLNNNQKLLNKIKYNLDEQIRRVVVMLEPKWSEKNIEFDLNLQNIEIYADVGLMEQVWINIIDNSIKFSNKNGRVHVQIKKYDSVVDIRIKDNGIGISESNLSKIFNRFHQADESRKDEGSGLGLTIAREILILHEGNIRVKSKVGFGTEFIVSLIII